MTSHITNGTVQTTTIVPDETPNTITERINQRQQAAEIAFAEVARIQGEDLLTGSKLAAAPPLIWKTLYLYAMLFNLFKKRKRHVPV